MEDIIKTFNAVFEGRAKAEIDGYVLKITIGGTTLLILLPHVMGGQSE